jgi:hypothetical protein
MNTPDSNDLLAPLAVKDRVAADGKQRRAAGPAKMWQQVRPQAGGSLGDLSLSFDRASLGCRIEQVHPDSNAWLTFV